MLLSVTVSVAVIVVESPFLRALRIGYFYFRQLGVGLGVNRPNSCHSNRLEEVSSLQVGTPKWLQGKGLRRYQLKLS